VSTPTLRYDESHHSRAGEVVTSVIGENVQGVRGSDVSAGDTIHQGWHQRGWAHCVRDIHTRKEHFPEHADVWRWANAVKDVSDQAEDGVAQGPDLRFSPR
jgi:hypothetical protein